MFALADCNNFFASCERVFRPDLRDKPVVVLSNNDGCAIARSNEAKALGIKMGDPLFKIRDIVERNNVAIFSGNMALYGDMSQRVRWVLEQYAPAIEVYSIDEAFLDLRGVTNVDFDSYAKHISQQCYKLTSIPVSVGIAPTKTLAKIASKLCKSYPKLQGGCYMHRAQDIEKVLKKYPISDVWGIGRRSVVKLEQRGVHTAYDFTLWQEFEVRRLLGITGVRTWRELRGESCIEFENGFEMQQSVCVSRSFASEIYDVDTLCEQIANFASSVAEKLRRQNSAAGQLVVFAFTNRFKESEPQQQASRITIFPTPTSQQRAIVGSAVECARQMFCKGYGYKKAGVVATHIVPYQGVMHTLFEDEEQNERESRLSSTLDKINNTFGRGAVKLAVQGNGQIKSNHNNRSPRYTTHWSEIPEVTIK